MKIYQKLIENIGTGEDENGTAGFWDYAGQIALDLFPEGNEHAQDIIYQAIKKLFMEE